MQNPQLTKLLKRIQRVGWPHRRTKNSHYVVYPPNAPEPFTFATTTNDPHGIRNAIMYAERAGLTKAEEAQAAEREQVRRMTFTAPRVEDIPSSPPGLPNPAGSATATAVTVVKEELNMTAVKPAEPPVANSSKFVDGVEVVERHPAKFQTPIMPRPGASKTVDEILLANGEIKFQCMVRPDECFAAFDKFGAAHAHTTSHSKKEKALETKTTTPKKSSRVSPKLSRSKPVPVAEAVSTPTPAQLTARIDDLTDRLDGAVTVVRTVTAELSTIANHVDTLCVIDDETRRKAAEYDKLRAAFQMLNPSS